MGATSGHWLKPGDGSMRLLTLSSVLQSIFTTFYDKQLKTKKPFLIPGHLNPPASLGTALPRRVAPRLTLGSSAHHGVSRGEALPSVALVTRHGAPTPCSPSALPSTEPAPGTSQLLGEHFLGKRTGRPRRRLQEASRAPYPGSCRALWHPWPPH